MEFLFLLFQSKAQGTIEYLLLIGVIVAMALIAAGIFLNSTPPVENLNKQANSLGNSLNELELSGFAIDTDGNAALILKNNSDEKLTINHIYVDSASDHNFGELKMYSGSKKTLVLTGLTPCLGVQEKSYSIKVSYKSAYNLDKNADFGARTALCAPKINPTGSFTIENPPAFPIEDPIIGAAAECRRQLDLIQENEPWYGYDTVCYGDYLRYVLYDGNLYNCIGAYPDCSAELRPIPIDSLCGTGQAECTPGQKIDCANLNFYSFASDVQFICSNSCKITDGVMSFCDIPLGGCEQYDSSCADLGLTGEGCDLVKPTCTNAPGGGGFISAENCLSHGCHPN